MRWQEQEDNTKEVQEEVFLSVERNMDINQTSYCTVLDKKSQSKYICYTNRINGIFRICLTDAAGVWSTEYTEDTLNQFRQTFALKSTEDYILKLRSACGSGDVSVVEHESGVELHVGSSAGDPRVTLSRLEGQQATAQLKELLFRMADSLTQTDSGSTSVSPVKNHQRRPTGNSERPAWPLMMQMMTDPSNRTFFPQFSHPAAAQPTANGLLIH
uniref:protein PAXX isoform X4 n=1 Tax=Scatophagus argus TaxID=75038 RepID=UPI001ED7E03C|nr:protein PAXX isoform X4 [Scatophagus argus]